MSVILGIDPGSRITGYGIIESHANGSLRYVGSGCIRIKAEAIGEKLYTISEGIRQLMEEFRPSEVSVESVFMHRNAMSALKLGQARGAAIAAAAHYAAEVFEYSARQIKQAVVGYGAAEKEQVQAMICRLLQLKAMPQRDASDALAIALCHLHTKQGTARIQSMMGRIT